MSRSLSTNCGSVESSELLHSVRLQAVHAPDALDGAGADPDDLRHHRGGPMGRRGWRFALGERHDPRGDVRPQRRDARRPRLVSQQAVIVLLHEALLPAPDTGLRGAGPAHDLVGAHTISAQQHDLRPPDMASARRCDPQERLQSTAISGFEGDGNPSPHAPDSHACNPLGIPAGIQMSDVIH